MPVITKDELRSLAQPRTATIAVPELGPDAEVTIRGYTVQDRAEISQACLRENADGSISHDIKQDKLLSLCRCLVDPAISLDDTGWVQELDADVVDRILLEANRLSRRTVGAYDELKSMMRANPLMRRLYTVCVENLGRFPADLPIAEEEFMRYLAAAEVQGEEEEQAVKDAMKQAKAGM